MLSRRELIKSAALFAGASALPMGFGRMAWAQQAEGRKMNILFIAVDDLKPELPCYGHDQVIAPNIEKLAAGGTVFTKAYCQQAICGPTRASLLTGCRPDTTKVHGLQSPLQTTSPHLVSIPRHYRDNGYRSMGCGKVFHHGPAEAPGGYDDFPTLDYPAKGRGNSYMLPVNQIAPPTTQPRKTPFGPAVERADVPDEAYHDGAVAAQAVRQLEMLAKSDQPFILSPGFIKPHLPFAAPAKYWDMYDRSKLVLPKFQEAPKKVDPMVMQDSWELRTYDGVPRQGPFTEEQQREWIHGYYACITYVDTLVGKILDTLERTGQAANTAVMIWGDHGWHLGDHGMWAKHTNFEQATRAPLIVRAPGMAGGQHCDALVEFVDMFPTLCDLTGTEKPAQLEGDSFLPLLKQPNRPWKKAAFSEYPRGKLLGRSVRTERYRFTRWAESDARGLTGVLELYDYQNDPEETVNIAADESSKALVAEMAAILDAGWKGARPA